MKNDHPYLFIDTGNRHPDDRVSVANAAEHEALFLALDEFVAPRVPGGDRVFTQKCLPAIQLALPANAVRRANSRTDAWDWPDGSAIVISTHRVLFPDVIERPDANAKRIGVADRPMQLNLSEDTDAGFWWAVVRGYASNNMQLTAMIGARSVGGRERLLSSLLAWSVVVR